MFKNPFSGPVETKVAAGGGAGALVSLVFGAAAQYHWFTPPTPYLTALVVTVLSTVAAYFAKHTPRPVPLEPVATGRFGPSSNVALTTATGSVRPVTQASAGTNRPSDPGPGGQW